MQNVSYLHRLRKTLHLKLKSNSFLELISRMDCSSLHHYKDVFKGFNDIERWSWFLVVGEYWRPVWEDEWRMSQECSAWADCDPQNYFGCMYIMPEMTSGQGPGLFALRYRVLPLSKQHQCEKNDQNNIQEICLKVPVEPEAVAISPLSVKKRGCWGDALAASLEWMYSARGLYEMR